MAFSALTTPPHWFITGASGGLGLELALHVLRAGHHVTGTVRSRMRSAAAVSQIEAAGGSVVELDTTSPKSVIVSVIEALPTPVDVLVNNAGYSLLGAAEQFSPEEIEQQMRTNVYGPIYAIQAVLPSMRERKVGGTIVNVSSVAAKDPLPTCAMYSASKMALEGFSEALSLEVAPFGISVLIVEPGAFRTNFLTAIQVPGGGVPEAYKGGPVDTTMAAFVQRNGKQPGDPVKAAARIFEAVTGDGLAGNVTGKNLRLVIGQDAMTRMRKNNARWVGDMDACEEVAKSTDI